MDKNNLISGKEKLIHNIKLVLYNKSPNIFEELDFDNNLIYTDPIVFAGINSILKPNIDDLLWGYKPHISTDNMLKIATDENGICYISNVGYFYTNFKSSSLNLSFSNNEFVLKNKNLELVHFNYKTCFLIHDRFEVLLHPYELLKEHFYDGDEKIVDVEITEVTKDHLPYLSKAFDIIEECSPDFYELLEICVRKLVIFKSNTYDLEGAEIVERNSFATLSVHGCAFFNAFQDNYNEVYFIEDVAHQCGHVIFNTYLASEPNLFLIDPETNIAAIEEVKEYNETRSLFVVVHAMYTYDCIFTCFNDCLVNNVFKNDKDKEHELIGRLVFNLNKFVNDFNLLSQLDNSGTNLYFNDAGMQLLRGFLTTYKRVLEKSSKIIKDIDLSNQPYNFSYKIFLQHNPIKQNETI